MIGCILLFLMNLVICDYVLTMVSIMLKQLWILFYSQYWFLFFFILAYNELRLQTWFLIIYSNLCWDAWSLFYACIEESSSFPGG